MYQRYGPVVREKIGGKNIIHVFDPEDIKTVYSVEGRCILHICLFYALSVKSIYKKIQNQALHFNIRKILLKMF